MSSQLAENKMEGLSAGPEKGVFTLSMLVANKPGVLGRIALVFSRRGFNIESLNVSHTLDSRFSRMVIVTEGSASQLDDIGKQTRNLVDVVHFSILGPRNESSKVQRRLRLVLDECNKPIVLGIVEEFKYKMVDFSNDSVTIEALSFNDEYSTFLEMLKHYGSIEHFV